MLNRELNYKKPGMEPYIFISVSSDDLDRVEPIIDRLDQKGFRRWYYVDGIEYSEDYRSAFAERLKNCAVFLAFLSVHSANSKDCLLELYSAYKADKKMFFIYLDDRKSVNLNDGAEIIVDPLLYLEYDKCSTIEEFMRKLCGAECMQKCRKVEKKPHDIKASASGIVYDPNEFEIAETTLVKCKRLRPVIEVPNGVKRIGKEAFTYKNLNADGSGGYNDTTIEIKLPESVKEIGSYAFLNCKALKKMDPPSKLVKIGVDAFRYCESLERMVLPEGFKEIYNGAFAWCKNLSYIELPQGIQKIGFWAFEYCSNLEIHISRYTDPALCTTDAMIQWNPDFRPVVYYE